MTVVKFFVLLFSFYNLKTEVLADATFRFSSSYGDHMVLQRAPERAVIWGFASNVSAVSLYLSGSNSEQKQTVPVLNGTWKVALDPVPAGGPYILMVIPVEGGREDITLVLNDVMFGDVWLCGGQSNMAFTVSQLYKASKELALAKKFPDVRIFQTALQQSEVELDDLTKDPVVPWSRPTAELLGGEKFTHFSAVCWLFGRYLYKRLKYPIGLVESCEGGTPVEAWSSSRALKSCGLQSENGRPPRYLKTSNFSSPLTKAWNNSVLWNAMIHPLLGMTIKGAIWYQGEANTNYNREKYWCSFPAMINDWRLAFHTASLNETAPDFPFGFVQLCTYMKKVEDGFPEIRWHQTADYGFVPNPRMKNTFMAVTMDLPDQKSPYGSIHPRDKQDVAYRLMLGARAVAYKETGVAFWGPFPNQDLQISQSILNITFSQRISGTLSYRTFEICCSEERNQCENGSRWIPAPMKELGSEYVLVSSAGCPMNGVAALRYAWTDWPCHFKACPVYSADGVLPAPPFLLYIKHSPAKDSRL